ncbi:GNAT family N-acetyltransferase [Candidatus Marinimicrobia bacterium MT.SAG.4]|nr:GNAT family N-acetyltransferase [Candidatus Marinimicrobia bacterium MT.SAG.4]
MTNSEKFEIREAIEADIPLVLHFIKELAEYEKLSHIVEADIETLRESMFGESANSKALLAYYEREPVGFAVYFYNFSSFVGRRGLYLEDLYIDPTMRSKGFGKALLKRLAQIAIEKNCGRMEWVVLDWNEPAIEFYVKLGAEALGDWTTFRLNQKEIETLAAS